MKNLVVRFFKDESGATAIEYALLAALIGSVMVAGATTLGGAVNTKLSGVAGDIT
ncbi:MAG: Flp family type IVb pilin [Cohaesibacteraceae bacterium]|nr:Flp family type IVb pilin [Cohaesibacteraceae bacterium]PCH80375.1 MAG: Flp family type IVb pilin [Hyphomicrobiales bacterium]